MLIVMCVGTLFDFFAHQTSERFAVPEYYFRNKLIFGTLIGWIGILILRRFVPSDRWLAFWVTLGIAVALQTRYYLEGYDPTFVFLFMGIHFVVFFIPAFLLFPHVSRSLRSSSPLSL